MKTRIKLLLLLSICITSCDTYEFNPDPIDPRLPSYSEEGKNTGGGYINDSPPPHNEKCLTNL